MDVRQGGLGPEVVVHVEHVGQEAFGGPLLEVQLLHLVLHHDGFPCDLFAGPAHAEGPWDPL